MNYFFSKYCVLFCVLIFGICSANAENMLKNYTIQQQKDVMRFTIYFNQEIEYVDHRPTKKGKYVQVKLKIAHSFKSSTRGRETLAMTGAENTEVEKLVYEANTPGGPFLIIAFNTIMRFELITTERLDRLIFDIKIEYLDENERNVPAVDELSILTSEENSRNLLAEGRVALIDGRNADAILIFTQFLNFNNKTYKRNAKELLGLARERNEQIDLALQEYASYLVLYPDSERRIVVWQRLMALKVQRLIAQKKLIAQEVELK